MPIRRFDLSPPDVSADDPIQFALGDELFTCMDDLSAHAVLALTATGKPTVDTFAFLRAALVAGDEDRFDATVARKDQLVTEEVLTHVLRYVVECYAARPTRRPSSSPGGPLNTNGGSERLPAGVGSPSP